MPIMVHDNVLSCDKNIGGIPLFLFDKNLTDLIINFKKELNFKYYNIFNIFIGGFMIPTSYIIKFCRMKSLRNILSIYYLFMFIYLAKIHIYSFTIWDTIL
jgi:hypothetical protein